MIVMVVAIGIDRTIMYMEGNHSICLVPMYNDQYHSLVLLILKVNHPVHLDSEDKLPVHLKSMVREEHLVETTLVSETKKNLYLCLYTCNIHCM